MRRIVQIVLVAALLPMAGAAREETLEERKKRITRKYLRENMQVTQSEMLVPSDLPPEDEQVADSEQFREPQVELSRQQQPGTPMPPPQQRRPMPQQEESNWLLEGLDDEDRDPYADPFALDKPKNSETDYWSSRNQRNQESRYGSSRGGNPYERRSYDPYESRSRYGTSRYGNNLSQQQEQTGVYSSQPQTRYNRSGSQGNQTGITRYGSDPSGTPGSSLTTPRTYGASPDSGLLNSPFPQSGSAYDPYRRKDSTREKQGGYKPYESPYKSQRQQPGPYGTQNRQDQETYQKPDMYKQWKDKNKSLDPTRDDAYLDELMRQNRR